MQRSNFFPLLLITILVIALIPACGSSPLPPTPQALLSSPSIVPTLRPTITTLPTYTPRPIKTVSPTPPFMPTNSPSPIIQTATGQASLANCIPSETTGYNVCTDNSGSITVDLPETWSDINGSTWTYKGLDIGFAISAAPNLSEFQNNFDAEGIFFGASGTFAQVIGHIELLDYYTTAYSENCVFIDRVDYNDGIYRGKYDRYSSCGGEGGYDAYVLGARDISEPSEKLILIEIQSYPNDTTTVNQILATFFVYF